MARFSTLLALCAAATAATASPFVVRDSPVSLPLARRVAFTGAARIVELDQARAALLKNVGHGKGGQLKRADLEAVNQLTHYTVEVGIGSPATTYTLLVDTGSANTFIGVNQTYVKTSTSNDTGNSVSVTYGSGRFSGEQFTDTVTLGNVTIQNQGISVANQTLGFPSTIDGILGIGPSGLTKGTVSGGQVVPTVLDNAFEQGAITAEAIGISFEPASNASTANGLLTLGGSDSSRFVGNINVATITGTSPASNYVGIDQTVRYGNDTPILSQTAGIVDTGTTLILLASDAFAAYKNATGAVTDTTTGLLKITNDQYANLQSLFFTINLVDYELIPNAQIWPRSLNTLIGGDANSIYLVVADLGSKSGEGLDFINGYSWLERFYHVYVPQRNTVGFANTQYTHSEVN
ncbi:transporter [Ganoderma sinense ZZ0214-1]|uniref:Transporter n=1 Tax=Ganoderma sinense ZZ0214-1 TaxID=1077348 RepID=A0A2G8S558_9APHY|nr:transporter [Ganoderma sinense ZZ0214-1]